MRARRGAAVAAAVAVGAVVLPASPARADDVVLTSNPTIIEVPTAGQATPYPSTVEVTGASLPIVKVAVVLHGLSHESPQDLDIVLVGPTGLSTMLMSDAGGTDPVNGLELRFEDGAMQVDADALGAGTFSPTDLEPNDVMDSPSPQNPGAAPLSAFTGTSPIGVWELFVFDDNGETGAGSLASGWSLELTLPSDACLNPIEDGFTDVDEGNPHEEAIDCLVTIDIAHGTTLTTFGPTENVSRAQMASFIARVIAAGGVELEIAPPDAFGDDTGSVHELRINQLRLLGVIGGNGEQGASYFPSNDMRRDHMASFMAGAFEAVVGAPLPPGPDAFTDDAGNPHEAAINALAATGVITGTGGGLFDPNGSVSRAQMGSFLSRLVQLHDQNGHPPV